MDQASKDTQSTAPLRVFVSNDRPVVFNGVDTRRDGNADAVRAGDAAGTGRTINLRPNVAVLDLSTPGLDGIEAARKFIASSPECRVLAITAQDQDGAFLRQLFALGVSGCVSKGSSAEDLLRGIQTVGSGGLYCNPAEHDQAPHAASTHDADRNAVAELSTREIEVLRLAAAGHSNKTIAAKLQIGSKSVETYKARGMAKLGFHSRVEVVRFALNVGWLSEQSN